MSINHIDEAQTGFIISGQIEVRSNPMKQMILQFNISIIWGWLPRFRQDSYSVAHQALLSKPSFYSFWKKEMLPGRNFFPRTQLIIFSLTFHECHLLINPFSTTWGQMWHMVDLIGLMQWQVILPRDGCKKLIWFGRYSLLDEEAIVALGEAPPHPWNQTNGLTLPSRQERQGFIHIYVYVCNSNNKNRRGEHLCRSGLTWWTTTS